MLKLRQAIVVEGKYDKITISQLVDAPIFMTNGFGLFKDQERMALLRLVAEKRGLVVLTDSDGAGLVIRNRIKSCIPPQYLLHAYIPDVYGKEKRKTVPGKEGKLGVEGMDRETILASLRNAGASFLEETDSPSAKEPITKTDLYELGLTGTRDSRERRLALQKQLGLPENLSSNALLTALNCLYTKEKLEELLWRPGSSTSRLPAK